MFSAYIITQLKSCLRPITEWLEKYDFEFTVSNGGSGQMLFLISDLSRDGRYLLPEVTAYGKLYPAVLKVRPPKVPGYRPFEYDVIDATVETVEPEVVATEERVLAAVG
jgi:hypothetical protein